MVNNRAKILLDRINSEFELVTLREDTTNLLSKAPLIDVIRELSKHVDKQELDVLSEAIKNLKKIGM